MEKYSNPHHKTALFFDSVIESLSQELTDSISENVRENLFRSINIATRNMKRIMRAQERCKDKGCMSIRSVGIQKKRDVPSQSKVELVSYGKRASTGF